jgi:hypothetical protein
MAIQSVKGYRVGQTVYTTKGSKDTGPFAGKITGFGESVNGKTVNLEKRDGKIVYCLLNNIQSKPVSAKGKDAPKRETKKPKKDTKKK